MPWLHAMAPNAEVPQATGGRRPKGIQAVFSDQFNSAASSSFHVFVPWFCTLFSLYTHLLCNLQGRGCNGEFSSRFVNDLGFAFIFLLKLLQVLHGRRLL